MFLGGVRTLGYCRIGLRKEALIDRKRLLSRLTLWAFLLIVGPAALASEGREIEYEKINRLLSTVNQSKSPLIQSEIKLEILSDEISYDDVKVSIVNGNQMLQEIPVDVITGTIELPVFEEETAKQIALKLNQDKDALVVNLNAGIKPPSSTMMPYKDLFIVVEDFNQFIKKMAGAMSFFAPKTSALKFQFDQPATIEIPANTKTHRYDTDSDQAIEIKMSSRLMKENPNVIFSTIPASVEPTQ